MTSNTICLSTAPTCRCQLWLLCQAPDSSIQLPMWHFLLEILKVFQTLHNQNKTSYLPPPPPNSTSSHVLFISVKWLHSCSYQKSRSNLWCLFHLTFYYLNCQQVWMMLLPKYILLSPPSSSPDLLFPTSSISCLLLNSLLAEHHACLHSYSLTIFYWVEVIFIRYNQMSFKKTKTNVILWLKNP